MFVIFWILFAIVSAMALSRFNKAGMGFLLGLLLGPFGLIAALIWRSNLMADENKKAAPIATADRAERECPYCAERILAKARLCKHCGREVEPKVPSGRCTNCQSKGIALDEKQCPVCNAKFNAFSGVSIIPD